MTTRRFSALRRPRLLLACGWLWMFSGLAASGAPVRGGLKTNYSKIFVENLPIGHTVSMRRIANLPLVVGNRFGTSVTISVRAVIPETPRPGFEAVPDAAWIALEASNIVVSADSESTLDVSIALPDDESLFGRRFQADLIVQTEPGRETRQVAVGYQITGSLLFSVAPLRNEAALQRALDHPADASFELIPPRVDLFDVRAGQTVRVLAANHTDVALVNRSAGTQRYVLASVNPAATTFTPDPGSRFTGRADEVRLADDEILLPAGSTHGVPMEITVPADADLDKGPLIYLVSVRSGATQGIEQFIKIYLWNGPRPEAVNL